MAPFKSIGFLLASAIVAASAFAENCADTTFTALSSTSCHGAFIGKIIGAPAETTYLNSVFRGPFTYAGRSDDVGNGPFTSNPTVSTNGTLTFDSALSGTFVIGLKAATQYSYYFFNASTPVSSVTFSSTAGVAQNNKGIAQNLGHATLYYGDGGGLVTAVPELEIYALMLGGIGGLAFIARRRKSRSRSRPRSKAG